MAPLVSIRRFRAVIACIFAASILTVIVCDVVCGFGRTLLFTNQGNFASVVHPKEIAKSGHHQHGDSHDSNHHHHDEAEDPQGLTTHSQSTSSSEKDDCCEDMTSLLFKSLFKNSDEQIFEIPLQGFILLHWTYNQTILIADNYTNLVQVPPKIFPNLGGIRLRIQLSSFLI
ncbi:MAG TPA: hypothetical protein PLV21_03710 [Cyclobacteriaceae bacterium]|nr:hypothetical protein [Cyclobacteriaceae bacterium]HRJ80965.1 hypothetical protein [Cyclobacteriaceae bacterium]